MFQYFIDKIKKQYHVNYISHIEGWFDTQLNILLNHLDETNEKYNEVDVVRLMAMLYQSQHHKKEKIRNVKQKYNFFRKTLKRRNLIKKLKHNKIVFLV